MASDFFLPGGILDEEPDEAEEEVGEPASSYSFRFPLQQRSPGAAATRSSSTVAQGWHERISTSGIVPDGALHFRQRTSFYEHNPCLQPAIPQSYAVTSGQSEHASAQPYRRRLQGGIGRLGTLQDASSAALPAAGLGHSTKGRLGSRIPFTGGESLGKRATRSGKAEHAVYGGSVQGGRHASRSREVNDSASRFRPVVASARRRQRSSCPPNKHEFDQEVPQLNRECSSFHKLESPEPQDLVLQKSSSEFAPTTAPGRIRKSAIAEPCEPVEIQAPEVDPVSTLAMMTPEDKASGATVQSGHARSLTCKEGEYKTERGMFADQLLPASAVCALKAQKKCGKGKFRLSSSVDVLDVSNQNSSSNEQDGRGNREELPVMHEAKVEISRAEKLQKGGKLKEKKPKEREMKEDCNLEVKRLPSSSTQRQHQKLGREGKRAWAVRGTLTERATLHLASVSKSIFYYLTIKALQAVKIVVEFVTYIAGRCALVLMSAQELFTFPPMILWLLREGLLIFLCLLGSLTARALAIIVAIVDVHKYAIRELLSNGDLAICFAMPYALRRMAPQLALFGRHWVQVCLWYYFLVQLLCSPSPHVEVGVGGGRSRMMCGALVPVLHPTVTDRSSVIDLTGPELLLLSLTFCGTRSGCVLSPVFLSVWALQALAVVFLPDTIGLQYIQFVASAAAIHIISLHELMRGDRHRASTNLTCGFYSAHIGGQCETMHNSSGRK